MLVFYEGIPTTPPFHLSKTLADHSVHALTAPTEMQVELEKYLKSGKAHLAECRLAVGDAVSTGNIDAFVLLAWCSAPAL